MTETRSERIRTAEPVLGASYTYIVAQRDQQAIPATSDTAGPERGDS